MVGPRLLAIVGPTASGKTALALRLAEALDGEIVCCDALQLRAGLPLLTAKPTPEEQRRVPHHLLAVLPLSGPATAAQYVELADAKIAELRERGKTVVLCGGTGLYLRALVQGIFAGPAADPALRQSLRAEAQAKGTPALHQRLQSVDPAAAARISPNDYVRIERALEVFLQTGTPISEWQLRARPTQPRYDVLRIGLDPGQQELRERIRARVQAMVEGGVCQEVAEVATRLGRPSAPPLGYDVVWRHLQGEWRLPRMCDELFAQTVRYARRQRTWFRCEPQVHWHRCPEEVALGGLLAVKHPHG